MRIKEKLANLFGIQPKQFHINPESLTEYNLNKALQYENAEKKAEIDKIKLELAKVKGTKNQQEKEQELKLQLNEKKDELHQIKASKYFSLKIFFKTLSEKKDFSNNLFFTDFSRGDKLDQFEDFGFSEDGQIVIVGKNGVLMKMYNLKDIFQSVRGLNNDVPTGKIPLCLDKDGAWCENLLEYDIPEVQRKDMGLQYFKARKRPLYEIVADKNNQISQLRADLEEQEQYTSELEQEIDDLNRGIKLNENSRKNIQKDFSKSLALSSNVERALNSITSKLDSKGYENIVLEENLEKLESQITKIRSEAEREGIKLSDDKALELIQNIRRELVKDEPQIKIVEVPKYVNDKESGLDKAESLSENNKK